MSISTFGGSSDLMTYTTDVISANEVALTILGPLQAILNTYSTVSSSEFQSWANNDSTSHQNPSLVTKFDSKSWITVTDIVTSLANDEDSTAPEIKSIAFTYSTIFAIFKLTNTLLDSSLATLDELNYYDSTLANSRFIRLYALQVLPRNIYYLVREVIKRVNDTSKWKELKDNAMQTTNIKSFDGIMNFSSQLYQLIKTTLTEMANSFDSPITSILRSYKSIYDIFKVTVGVPFTAARLELRSKRHKLAKFQRENVELLGWLLNNSPDIKAIKSIDDIDISGLEFDFSIIENLNYILTTRKLPTDNNNLELESSKDISKLLLELVNENIPMLEKSNRELLKKYTRPNFLSRNWIIIIPALVVLPQMINSAYHNKDQIKDSIIQNIQYGKDVLTGFWRNWVVEPLSNVIRTIRHDPDSRLALMSERSLESDLGSLERMVVEYVTDNKIPVSLGENLFVNLSNSSGDERELALQSIKTGIQHGDLTLLLKDYETALPHPIKELLLGQMLRNVLIQIQKTKVDGSVALSGIDKIVRSQELVFGCIAASPALLGLWLSVNWGIQSFMGRTGGFETTQTAGLRLRIRKGLGNVSRLVDKLQTSVSNYERGLLFIEVVHLELMGSHVIPSVLVSDWQRELVGILSEPPNTAKLAIQRLWNVYSSFL